MHISLLPEAELYCIHQTTGRCGIILHHALDSPLYFIMIIVNTCCTPGQPKCQNILLAKQIPNISVAVLIVTIVKRHVALHKLIMSVSQH